MLRNRTKFSDISQTRLHSRRFGVKSGSPNSPPKARSTQLPFSRAHPRKRYGSDLTRWCWWTWSQRIRTQSALYFEFILLDTTIQPLYQEISAKSVQLYQLGLSKSSIATKLNVDEKTVSKAIRWANQD